LPPYTAFDHAVPRSQQTILEQRKRLLFNVHGPHHKTINRLLPKIIRARQFNKSAQKARIGKINDEAFCRRAK